MRPLTRSLLVALLLAARTAAAADAQPAASGFEAAFRSGIMIPAGDVGKDVRLSDYSGLAFPLWVDVGYRFADKFFVGASALYAFGLLGDTYKNQCSANGLSCSNYGVQVGGQLQYHPLGRVQVDPWVGIGFGYEWVTTKISGGGQSTSVTLHGWDFLQLQVGVDFALGSLVRLGPFAGFIMGQYDKIDSAYGSIDISDKALHYWFSVGLKLTVLP